METELEKAVSVTAGAPLSAEEAATWEWMVEEGRRLRAPIVARQEAERAAKPERIRKMLGKTRDAMTEVPVAVRRWVIARMAGLSFRRAAAASGATWLAIQDARAHSEVFRCALAAQEENARQLMRAKAESVVEQSQEEDAKVSLAQTQVSMRILECLDRSHFGVDERKVGAAAAEEVKRQLGGGGFVINLVGDAAQVAASAPAAKPGRALVFSEV